MRDPRRYIFAALFVTLQITLVPAVSSQTFHFERYFHDATLRMDYYHSGARGVEILSLDRFLEEGIWAGSKRQIIDTLNLGEYLLRVYDRSTNQLIFSRGFSSIFHEWQSTDEADRGTYRSFHATVRLPMPRKEVQVTIAGRDQRMNFRELLSVTLDPEDPAHVSREKKINPYGVLDVVSSGPAAEKVDIVILGDGYARGDMERYRRDVRRFNDMLFSTEPFARRKNDFNVRAVEVISAESGIDKPDVHIWKETALGTSYNTFGSPRYVLTEANAAVRDIAGTVPYDFIIILLNDNRYGGGGIFNLYATCYAQTDVKGMEWQMDYVYVHEFGHSFAGLGDEYYSSQVAYNDLYPDGVEPWEPNLTAFPDPGQIKWKHLLTAGTPLPTPWEKERFDSLELERGKLDRLAPDYYEKREPLYRAGRQILETTRYTGVVGAFQGAGYESERLYRPSIDCRMFSLSLVDFDPVCTAAIERMIDLHAR